MSDTRYLILLPLKFPEDKPVPAEYITETQIELARRFGDAGGEWARAAANRLLHSFRLGEGRQSA